MTREEKILRIKQKLRKEAEKKFPGNKERQDRYVFGTLNKIKERNFEVPSGGLTH